MTHEELFRAVERAYRCQESTDLRAGQVDLARIVAPSSRGNYFVVSRDFIRAARRFERLLRDRDIVVTSHGAPRFVVVTLEEYERLTGRSPQPPGI